MQVWPMGVSEGNLYSREDKKKVQKPWNEGINTALSPAIAYMGWFYKPLPTMSWKWCFQYGNIELSIAHW